MPGTSVNPFLAAAKKLRKVAAQAKRRGKRREVSISRPSPVVPNPSLDHVPDDSFPAFSDLVMPPQPAGAGPSRIQLTPAADSRTLSQILDVTHISTPPPPSPDTSPVPAFPFPRTKGGGLQSSASFTTSTSTSTSISSASTSNSNSTSTSTFTSTSS
ncbi:hypothetical protein LshimejAT787_0204420 [Lyophyllum shimeji]|uniref:Uncharacterized protein n=1 Tax=Lyophyllum shimeji TaxID=47721 RepID=A0A9P3PGB9_LYOSH|nr:hypothetical protein LshimejAT787_0204420 [Lyophyllum shimeji]